MASGAAALQGVTPHCFHKLRRSSRVRKAPVRLLPSLAQVLAQYRAHDGNRVTGPIFRTGNGTPLDPNSVLRDRMQPAL